QENGTQWRFPYGAPPLPLFTGGGEPSNVSWGSGDPNPDPSVVGGAAWWWNLTAHDSTTGALCSTGSPCTIPLVYLAGDSLGQAEDTAWANSVSNLSGGAIGLTLIPEDIITLASYGLFSGPGNNPWGIWGLGWVDDYSDPSDPTNALVPPNSAYTFSDAIASAFLYLNVSCSSSTSVWSTTTTPIPFDCQGAVYNLSADLANVAQSLPLGPSRDLAYTELSQLLERLGLYVGQGQVNNVLTFAPWIDPDSLTSNPWTGGFSEAWYTIRDRASPAVPLALRSVSAMPAYAAEGAPLALTATATGGTGGRSYSWMGLPPGCAGTTANLSCRPTSGGNFTVTVTVTDAVGNHVSGSVNLTVSGLAIVAFTATPSSFTLGSSTVLVVTLGGSVSGPHYAYSGLPTGCPSVDASTLSCTPNEAGRFTVQVTVSSTVGSARDTTAFTVIPTAPSIGAFVASRPMIDLGDSVALSVNGSSGSGPYAVGLTGVPGCNQSANIPTLSGPWSARLLCTPSTVGTFVANVTITDSNQLSTYRVTSLVVHALPSISSFALGRTAVDAGLPVGLTVLISGGTAPFTLAYTGLPTGCSSANSTTVSCTPTGPGFYTVTVTAVDALGHRASAQLGVLVHAPLAITGFVADPAVVDLGGATNFSVQVAGGSAPIAISFSQLPPGCAAGAVNATRWACTPTAPGSYTVTVSVEDAAQSLQNATTTLTVNPLPGGTTSGGTVFGLSLTTAALLIVVPIVAVVVIAALVIRRRRAEQGAPAEDPEGTAEAGTGEPPPG
ncbi:MAG TPA: hypothetical protein VEY07_08445, partial [Thermoplasmata archaeon]|nr:hypothetical protein [Thermoplasmata archaeon]